MAKWLVTVDNPDHWTRPILSTADLSDDDGADDDGGDDEGGIDTVIIINHAVFTINQSHACIIHSS